MSVTSRSLINTGGFDDRGGEQVQTPEAVVISPTRELAVQIKDESRKFSAGSGIRSVVAYGGTSTTHQRDQIRKGANVLIATPGRLLQFVDEGLIKFDKLRLVDASWYCVTMLVSKSMIASVIYDSDEKCFLDFWFWTKPTGCSTSDSCPTCKKYRDIRPCRRSRPQRRPRPP